MKFELGSGKLTFFQMEIFKCLSRHFGEFVSVRDISDEIYALHGAKISDGGIVKSISPIRKCLKDSVYEIANEPGQKFKLRFKNG